MITSRTVQFLEVTQVRYGPTFLDIKNTFKFSWKIPVGKPCGDMWGLRCRHFWHFLTTSCMIKERICDRETEREREKERERYIYIYIYIYLQKPLENTQLIYIYIYIYIFYICEFVSFLNVVEPYKKTLKKDNKKKRTTSQIHHRKKGQLVGLLVPDWRGPLLRCAARAHVFIF